MIEDLIKRIKSNWSISTCREDVRNNWNVCSPWIGQDDVSALCLCIEFGYHIYRIMINNRYLYFNSDRAGNKLDITNQLDVDSMNDTSIELISPAATVNDPDIRNRFHILCINMGAGYIFRSKYIIMNGTMTTDYGVTKNFLTSDVEEGKYIDTTTTGVPFYDALMKSEELRKNYNVMCHIEEISPDEYYVECAEMKHSKITSEKLKRFYTADNLDDLKKVILKHKKKFTLPYLNYCTEQCQEGFHRMACLGELFGWGTKFPVLIIKSEI